MKLKKRTVTTILIGLLGLISCSRQTTISTRISYIPSPVFDGLDTLLTASEISLAFYQIRPVKFYEPEIEIDDSFNNFEKSCVSAPDENLFAKRRELIIDFENIADDKFYFPLSGARVLSGYGRRSGRMHTGFDLKVGARDTIFSAFDGIVRMAGVSKGYGNLVVIRHYNGLETVYAHNSRHMVKSGDHVKAGMPIAITGRTGRASTEHLHFETRINGKTFDPDLIIDFENRSLRHKCLVFTPNEKGQIQIEQV